MLFDFLLISCLILAWLFVRSKRHIDLNAYYKTAHWQRVRRRKYKQAGGKCEICGSTERLETHHIRYSTLWRERNSDLQLLCHAHHGRGSGRR